jgi:hypothetical protein
MKTLDRGAGASARAITEGTGAMRAALAKEAETIHRLVDELYDVMEGRINLVGRH